jgi:phosphoribosylglycinamide formyltransferase 1
MSFEFAPVARPENRRVVVLISGGGTTLQNLLESQQRGHANFEITAVVSSSPTAAGLRFAAAANVSAEVISFGSQEEGRRVAAERVFALCRRVEASVVVLAGFLKHLLIPQDFDYRVLNIHPSLIPAFCGHGFYGLKVHQAVLDYGCQISGCTVHFVDNEFDHGPIIAQCPVEVGESDDAPALQRRVFAAECQLYPRVIDAYLDGRIERCGRRIRITPANG